MLPASSVGERNHTNNYAEAGIRFLERSYLQQSQSLQSCPDVFLCYRMSWDLPYKKTTKCCTQPNGSVYLLNSRVSRVLGYLQNLLLHLILTLIHSLSIAKTERGVKYLVDMTLCVCSCTAGQDGSPCSHQATVKHYHIPSVKCVPTLSPESRQRLASVALGFSSVQSPHFYSSLHQKKEEQVPPMSTRQVDNAKF